LNLILPLLALAVVGLFCLMATYERSTRTGGHDWRSAAALPVLHEGRVKPLDTVARNTLQLLGNRTSVIMPKPEEAPQGVPADLPAGTVSATEWMLGMMAGADFIKTSTGTEAVNATLPVSLVMMRQIRDFYQRTGQKVGFKPAGGITGAKLALDYLILVKEELGTDWLTPQLFRFGASSLLGDIERQLEHFATGRYSAAHRHPIG
jgi:hypothetical protein